MYKIEIKAGKYKEHKDDDYTEEIKSEQFEENSVKIIMTTVLRELDNQKSRKTGFENRAGIALALVGALSLVVIEKLKISEIVSRMYVPFDFFDFIYVSSGILFYFTFITSIICLLLVINSRKYNTVDPKYFGDEYIAESENVTEYFLVRYYRDLLLNHQDCNDILALQYTIGILSLMISVVMLIINLNL